MRLVSLLSLLLCNFSLVESANQPTLRELIELYAKIRSEKIEVNLQDFNKFCDKRKKLQQIEEQRTQENQIEEQRTQENIELDYNLIRQKASYGKNASRKEKFRLMYYSLPLHVRREHLENARQDVAAMDLRFKK